MQLGFDPAMALALTAGSAVATAVLIHLLQPWLQRYALARPNARSSHTVPTPQGGGIAVVIVVAAAAAAAGWHGASGPSGHWSMNLLVAIAALAAVGAIDDVRPLPVLPRLLLQGAVAGLLVMALPAQARVLPMVPPLVESAALILALVWFTNLVNFMDGIDLMTVVEVVPIGAVLAVLGMLGIVPELGPLLPVVLALLGAMLAFAPFNRHVAKLFLGDVGSLPIGALVGWLLFVLAGAGHLIAALILPLYYLADATITLCRRWLRGENISQAHRSHFYQLAVARGLSVPEVTGRVLALNALLAVLALASIVAPQSVYRFMCLGTAAVATLALLWQFERGRKA